MKREVVRTWVIRILIGVGVLAALAVLRTWLFAPESVPVRVVNVEYGRVEETVTNSRAGTVKARQRARLSPEIGGRVVAIHHRKGARVKAGDLIIQLNDASQRAQVLLTERELAVTTAKREQVCLETERARREYRRHKELSHKEFVSKDFLEKLLSTAQGTAAACRAARASIDRAEAAVAEAKAELDKTLMRAPFDGVIAELDTEVGEWTTPSPPAVPVPAVLDLLDPSSIYVSAPMDEVDSARIHLGQPVRITLDPYPGQEFPGGVTRMAPYVLDEEEQNRTVEIEVEFLDKEFAATLLPGTSADVVVILSIRERVLRIPSTALLEGNKVLAVENGRLAEVVVHPGLKNWDFVEINNGLALGQPVVTSLERAGVAPGVLVEFEDAPAVP